MQIEAETSYTHTETMRYIDEETLYIHTDAWFFFFSEKKKSANIICGNNDPECSTQSSAATDAENKKLCSTQSSESNLIGGNNHPEKKLCSSAANRIGCNNYSEKKRLRSTQLSAANIIGGNIDLLMELFLQWLPVKSLIQFKLVSKQWRSLISADYFSRLHFVNHCRRPEHQHSFILGLSNGIKLQYFICDPTVKKLYRFRLPFANVKLLQSCNGLLLLGHGKFTTSYVVFNPTTGQYRNLNKKGYNLALCLLFDPSRSDHYRVVHFNNDNDGKFVLFSVYDSTTHKWTDNGMSPDVGHKFSNSFFSYKNSIYFIRNRRSSSFYYSPEEKEKLLSLPPSPDKRKVGSKNYAVESNGQLHYLRLCLTAAKHSIEVDVYEMIDNKWLRRKSVDLYRFAGDEGSSKVELLGMIREERVEDSMLLMHLPGQILVYRFSDNVYEVVDDFRSHYFYQQDQLQFAYKDAHTFIESFAPV